jgi:hypothetical protein
VNIKEREVVFLIILIYKPAIVPFKVQFSPLSPFSPYYKEKEKEKRIYLD